MIVLDTCALVFDALTPEKLSKPAKKLINGGGKLYCCDISLWEVAMLVQKKRLDPGTDVLSFLQWVLQARQIEVLPITAEIASLSVDYLGYNHFDPADRLIAATCLYYQAKLITCDKKLKEIQDIHVVW